MKKRPNVVFVFSDQHRAEATGYAGNPDVKTPNMDKLAKDSINFTTAVAGNPVCCPYRASLITGQYSLTHGVFVNDVCLGNSAVSIAEAFKNAGYDTSYIGKWHLDGHGRSNYIPKERRHGFDYWKVLECTHNYNDSYYYGDEQIKLKWEGYDAEAQTKCAIEYIKERQDDRPFLLFLSWGPPHNPYETAPQRFKDMYDPAKITLRPNVPEEYTDRAREELAGYYSHISALDYCLGDLMDCLTEEGIEDDTVFVYTSDHGDMLWSQGTYRKQKPWDESILVPFLLRYPALFGHNKGREVKMPINSPDIMPTLLGLCSVNIPHTVEGTDYSSYLKGHLNLKIEAALIESIHPFGEWHKGVGGKEYRGIRTERHTYVRDLEGPWLLYDNAVDPYQLKNLCNIKEYKDLQAKLDKILTDMLEKRKDKFMPGEEYIRKWGYITDETGTVPYEW